MIISLLHPSRSRPYQAFNASMDWLQKAKHYKGEPAQIEYILSIDEDDPSKEEYIRAFRNLECRILINKNRSIVDAVNVAAKESQGNILIVISDDYSCPVGWNVSLLECIGDNEDFIVRTSDGTGSWLITLPILDRKYYEHEGFVYDPMYKHLFVDTEYTHKAILLDRVLDCSHLTFLHNHYTTNRTEKDALNTRNDLTWGSGEAIYLKRVKDNFGLKPEQIIGKMTDPAHIKWLADKGVFV